MNLREFNTLAVGDQVENAMTNGKGTVSKVTGTRTGRAVSVKWGDGNVTFPYVTQSTAWMHWNKVVQHASDCALHNGPALPVGPCDCGAEGITAQQAEDASKRAT